MDIKEFAKQTQPQGKRSILEPFANEILQLKRDGYALRQIKEFLEKNKINISLEGIRKFILSKQDQIGIATTIKSNPIHEQKSPSSAVDSEKKELPQDTRSGVSEFQKNLEAPVKTSSYKAILAQQQKEDKK